MSQEPQATSSFSTLLLTFLAGAAAGAVVVALTTPKSGPQLRGDIKDLSRRAKRRVAGLADEAAEMYDEMKERTALAAADLKRGISDSVNDLRG